MNIEQTELKNKSLHRICPICGKKIDMDSICCPECGINMLKIDKERFIITLLLILFALICIIIKEFV